MMSSENTLPPTESLIMVDRGWKQSKKRTEGGSVNVFKLGPTSTSPNRPSTPSAPPTGGTDSNGNTPTHRADPSISPQRETIKFLSANQSFGSRDLKEQRMIRSHVMKGRSRHANQRAALKESFAANSKALVTTTRSKGQHSDEENDVEPLLATNRSTNPRAPGSILSAYGALPFHMKPYYHQLLQYFLKNVAGAMYPHENRLIFNPARKYWFPMAISDDLHIHCILLSSAVHIANNPGTGIDIKIQTILGIMLPKLNARLKDRKDLSDTTIGTVIALAMVDNLTGNPGSWQMHMQGLMEMVKIRGGMSKIHPCLQIMLHKTDIAGSVTRMSLPYAPPVQIIAPAFHSLVPPTAEEDVKVDAFVTALTDAGVSPILIKLLKRCWEYAFTMQYFMTRSDSSFDPRSSDEDYIVIQRELLYFFTSGSGSDLDQSCGLVAMMYLKYILHQVPLNAPGFFQPVQRLQTSILAIEENQSRNELLIWLYTLGAIASNGSSVHSCFLDGMITHTETDLGPLSFSQIYRVLQKFLWIELLDNNFKQIFEQMEFGRRHREARFSYLSDS